MTSLAKPLILLTVLLSLTACESTSSESPCPPLKTYTPEFQNRLADELSALPPDSALGTAMVDYSVLRRLVRACRR